MADKTKIGSEQLASGVSLDPSPAFSFDTVTGAFKNLFSNDLYLETNIRAQEWFLLLTGWVAGASCATANTRRELTNPQTTRLHLGPVYIW